MLAGLRHLFPLLLGFMVLGWGTGYKLSLYRSQAAHDSSPTAKLCTRGSDAAKSDVDDAATGWTVEDTASLLSVVSIPMMMASAPVHRSERNEISGNPSPFRATPALFLRPPPAELRVVP